MSDINEQKWRVITKQGGSGEAKIARATECGQFWIHRADRPSSVSLHAPLPFFPIITLAFYRIFNHPALVNQCKRCDKRGARYVMRCHGSSSKTKVKEQGKPTEVHSFRQGPFYEKVNLFTFLLTVFLLLLCNAIQNGHKKQILWLTTSFR